MGVGLENVGISGVCGVRPAWPRVMSYPALMEKLDMGGPTGGAKIPGTEARGGLMGGFRGGTVAGGRKEELLVKGEASVEVGGKWEVVVSGLMKAGREGTGGRVVETDGLLLATELVPGRDWELDRPATQRTTQKCSCSRVNNLTFSTVQASCA